MQSSKQSLTIIGMGMSGLGCAYKLVSQNAPITLNLLEKSKKTGGRATTSSRQNYVYDYGANYFTFEGLENSEIIKSLIMEKFNDNSLVKIQKDVYTFTKDNQIQVNKDHQTDKYTYQKGIMHLSEIIKKQLKENEIQFDYKVDKLEYDQAQRMWKIIDSSKNNSFLSNFILLSFPAPQIAQLFEKSDYYKKDQIINIFQKCEYSKCICLIIALNKKITPQKPYFALLNTDREHQISWVSFEDDKQGHVPEDKSMLIVQMSDQFSNQFYEEKDDNLIRGKALEQLKGLIKDVDFDDNSFIWVRKWRYALPKNKIDSQSLSQFQQDGIFFAGDFLIGKGRVLLSLEKGLQVADQINAYQAKM